MHEHKCINRECYVLLFFFFSLGIRPNERLRKIGFYFVPYTYNNNNNKRRNILFSAAIARPGWSRNIRLVYSLVYHLIRTTTPPKEQRPPSARQPFPATRNHNNKKQRPLPPAHVIVICKSREMKIKTARAGVTRSPGDFCFLFVA